MKPTDFVKKWRQIQQKEISVAQSHFNDVCALVGHPTPLDFDPKGDFFTFEEPTMKTGGNQGRADVWFMGKFIWEYKGFHKNLDKAYHQLLLYREALGNPSLLITSDTQKIIIHTNFTNTIKEIHEVNFENLVDGNGLELLRRVFFAPESFLPTKTQEQVTQATADTFVKVAENLREWAVAEKRTENPEQLAHFIIRLLFSLFAEDLGILPNYVFTELVGHEMGNIQQFIENIQGLFSIMRVGGKFGMDRIPFFDGGLFDDDFVPDLPNNIQYDLSLAAQQDWSGIDPAIFGTLFERIIDESKRAQLGAHYTSKDDILLIIEPVIMQPLRILWQEVKQNAYDLINLGKSGEAHSTLISFSEKISSVKVLDPACGSGNFLYVALRQLLDLQKQVITFSGINGLDLIPLTVNPSQLFGIEKNPYAHELAQITVWIGYYQWIFENGFVELNEPILNPLDNIRQQDAVLDIESILEPDWPAVDVIVGNPPFLGQKKMRIELGDEYVDKLYSVYSDRLPACDLVCYWFEKARQAMVDKKCKRVGLLATQAIRGGSNRAVLDKIKESGDIFMAWSDRNWILDGAMVHVSIIGFDNGNETIKTLDGSFVKQINPDLTTDTDFTEALTLIENENIAFMGDTKVGPFDIDNKLAARFLMDTNNPNKRPNTDVVIPWVNATDITKRPREMWIIDYGIDMSEEEAKLYSMPFDYIEKHVKPFRAEARSGDRTGIPYWIHQRPRPEMREKLAELSRFIVTPATGKHRVFVWLPNGILPDHALFAFAREDDYFLGVLHSKVHEVWARRKGTQLREAESGFRYTATTTFETFPLPWSPGQENFDNPLVQNISRFANRLTTFRDSWLFPPEEDIGVTISRKTLKRRTMTNLYNFLELYRSEVKGKARNVTNWNEAVKNLISLDDIEVLEYIHLQLDNSVLAAYGWDQNLSDKQILINLLELNFQRGSTE